MEKKSYSRPGLSFVPNRGTLPTQDVAGLSDEALAQYLDGSGFWADARRYRADSGSYLLREIAGESILIPVDESAATVNCMFSLNESCLYLWQAFQTPHTVGDVLRQAEREFDAPAEVLERDIRAFVSEYLQVGLLKEEDREW